MKSIGTTICLILSIFVFGVLETSAQTIGLYFDQNGDQPYYNPVDIVYPLQVDLFIIAKNLDMNYGIDGWEVKLGWSESMLLGPIELMGQALNVGASPNYNVGLGGPLGVGTGTAVLAEFSVFALGPGEFFLGSTDISSIPGSEVPVYTSNGSMGPLVPEYGGNGSPSAAVGSTISNPSSQVLTATSRISVLEFRDGVLFGWISDQKSWIEMPKGEPGQAVELSPQQKDALRFVPILKNEDDFQNLAKKEVLFEDDFEVYTAGSGVPFHTQYPVLKKFNSGAEVQYPDVCAEFWGVLENDEQTNKYAFASAVKACFCEPFGPQCSSCNAYYYTDIGFSEGQNSSIELTSDYEIDLVPGKMYQFKFDGKSNGLIVDSNYMYTWLQINLPGGLVDYYRVGLFDWNTVDWMVGIHHNFLFSPSNYESGGKLSISFTSSRPDDFGGVYIDNVEFSVHNVDVRINSCVAYENNSDVPNPIIVTVEIANTGSEESGVFNLGYNFTGDFGTDFYGNPFPYEAVSVGTIPGNDIRIVEVSIPCPVENKTFEETIQRDVFFFADVADDLPELDEDNNQYGAAVPLTWHGEPNPPVIFIHGLLGGGLEKNESIIFGEDAIKSFFTMIFHSDKVKRDDSTDSEYDNGTMFTPTAYSDRGFLRNVALTIQRTIFEGAGAMYGAENSIPVLDMWEPLINNLTRIDASGENYLLPLDDPNPSYYEEQDIFLFNYDWRLDINPDRIGNLNGSTPTYDRLESLINRIKDNHPGADRLTIVSHSMGGLLTKAYLRANPEDHGVFRWITLGTPFQGSELAMASLFGNSGKSTPTLQSFC